MKNHYDTLGLEPFASYETISKAYKKLILLHHPDKQQQSDDTFIKVRRG
jgi:curved DNA-binding protein CbpA